MDGAAATPVGDLPPGVTDAELPQWMERQLQALPWEQFRAVIETEAKLKSDVEAYGPLGWAFVKKNYRSHPWSKNIQRLDESRRRQLLDALQSVTASPRDTYPVPSGAAPTHPAH